jgi:Sec-independent protein translocase protein TatA
MNFMGAGLSELAVVFLVAFLVLGPSRSISMVRNAGRFLQSMRRSFSELTDAVNLEQEPPNPGQSPGVATDQGQEQPPKAGNE